MKTFKLEVIREDGVDRVRITLDDRSSIAVYGLKAAMDVIDACISVEKSLRLISIDSDADVS